MTDTTVTVRPAEPGDVPGLARVHVQTWQTAYRGVFPDDYLDALDITEREQRWVDNLDNASQLGAHTHVAVSGGAVTGFVSWGPPPGNNHTYTGDVGELWALYVHPNTWGTGAADLLMEAAFNGFAHAGYRTAGLWVLDENPRARRFYERHGWVHTGQTRTDRRFEPAHVAEARYKIELPPDV